MGVAVAAVLADVFEAAKAGETLGPRDVVNAVNKASIFLGAAAALTRLNIFLLRPPAEVHLHKTVLPKNGQTRERVFRDCYAPVKDM